MIRLNFSIEIIAPIAQVFDAMLGLSKKETYNNWCSVFNPTSTYEGEWKKDAKIYFVGTDKEGNKAGMISEVLEFIPNELVTIRHYGFLQNGEEITSGPIVESWSGGLEMYSYKTNGEQTIVTVELDTTSDYIDYFNEMYPKALLRLKEYLQ